MDDELNARAKTTSKLPPRKYPPKEQVAANHEAIRNEVLNDLARLTKIQEKNKSLRVRFLDALSVKLHKLADRVKAMSNNIDMPTVKTSKMTELEKIVKVAGVPADKTFVPQPYIAYTTEEEKK